MKTTWPQLNRHVVACTLAALALSILPLLHPIAHAKRKSVFDPSGRPEFDALLAQLNKQGGPPAVRDYLSNAISTTRTNQMRILNSCTTIGPESSWPLMRFILRLDDSGVVKEARADSEAALANCMEKGWLGVQYSVPPVAPFYNMVTLEARSRGGV